MFGKQPRKSVNPVEAAAMGAAIQVYKFHFNFTFLTIMYIQGCQMHLVDMSKSPK